MDLMTLAAKITLDDSSYTKGIKNAESMGQQLAGKMSAATVAVGNLAADMIKKTVTAIGDVVGNAIDGYADYQQLIGGVETLFKDSANKVAKYAEQSYKTTGLSANRYMETVTSFSASLLRGLGGDTEQAAEMANMAVTDMADNANKMGTDISMIQSAYQGFAKQNYTMLDNLKLGYGGTQTEMVRLINDSKILDHEIENLDGITFDQLVQAIHVVQTEMGITGTTAAEAAGTISGSKASLEAAWSDFLVSIGGEADQKKLDDASKRFTTAFKTYVADNLAPTIKTTISNAPELISAVSDAITSLPTSAITKLAEGGIDLLTATAEGATKIGGWLVDGLIGLFKDINADQTKIADLGNAVGTFIGSALQDIVTNAPTIISGLFKAGVTLAGSIIEGLFSGLFGSESPMDELNEEMNDSIIEANINAEKSKSIIDYMDKLVKEYGKGVEQTTAFQKAQEDLKKYMGEKAGQVFTAYGSDVQGAIDKLRELNVEMRKTAILDAMRKNINAKYELLGEKGAEISDVEYKIATNQNLVSNFPQTLRNNLVAYAQEALAQGLSDEDLMDSFGINADQMREYIKGGAEGMDVYEMLPEILGLSAKLDAIYQSLGVDETNTVWGKDRTDELYSYEEIEAMNQKVEAAATVVAQETEKLVTLQSEYDDMLADIEFSEQSLQKQAQKIAENAGTAGDNIKTGGNSVHDALATVAEQIGSIRFPRGFILFGGQESQYTHEDTGIDYVPYSGFKAYLHKGEAVITAAENQERRSGAGSAEVVGAIQEMRADLQNLRLVVGEKTFGRAVVDYGGRRTMDYIGQAESRGYSGYGT